MAQTIKLKRSATTGNAPTTSQLALGELGINTTDGKLFLKKSVSGTESIVEVGGLPLSGGTLTGNLSLGDNVKLQLGNQTNGDLQIYHDGSASYIKENGTGDLIIQGSNTMRLQGSSNQELANFSTGGAVTLFNNGSAKIATTATGADITGVLTADGLTVDGNPVINGTSPQLFFQTGSSHANWQIAAQENVSNAFEISSGANDASAPNDTYTKRLVVQNNGDISFYNDSANQGLFFDSSTSRLGLGTTNPAVPLHVSGTARADIVSVQSELFLGSSSMGKLSQSGSNWVFNTYASGAFGERFRIKDTGVDVSGSVSATGNSVFTGNTNVTGSSTIGSTATPLRTLDSRGSGMAIFGTGSYTEIMLRERSGTTRNVGAWHWSVRGDVGGNNDDLKLLRFTSGSYQGVAMQVASATGNATFTGDVVSKSSLQIFKQSAGAASVLLQRSGATNPWYLAQGNTATNYFEIMEGSTPRFTIANGGNASFSGAVTANAGVTVDTINIDGNTIATSSGNFFIDSASDIFLDADGGNVFLRDNGTNFGNFNHNGSNLRIDAKETNGNIHLNPDGTGSVNVLSSLMVGATTAPSAKLQAQVNNTATPAQIATDSNAVLLLENTNASGSAGIRLRGGNGAGVLMYGENNSTDKFYLTPRNDTGKSFTLDHVGNGEFSGSVSTGSGGASGKIAITGGTATGEQAHTTFTNTQGAKTYAIGGGQSGVTNNGFVIRNVTDNTFPLVISDAGTSTFSGSVSTGNMTLSGQEIDVSSGDLTLDVAGDIILDADGGDILLKDGGAHWFNLANSSGANLTSMVQDADILLRGNDGGSIVTALTLDMSAAGAATFNSSVTSTGLTVSKTASGSTTQIASFVNPVGTANTGVRFWMSGTNTTTRGTFIDAVAESTSNNHTLRFGTSASSALPVERMRIDSSGNLLVGTTDTTIYNNLSGDGGIVLAKVTGGGRIDASRAGSCYTANRLGSDGQLFDFRKNGGIVGRISTVGNDLVIGSSVSGHKGVRFGSSYIAPINTSDAFEDNTTDLGLPAVRFKDLYLSNNATAQKLTLTKAPVGTYTIEVDGTNTGQPNLIVKQSTSERLRIDNQGRVGIGTSAPAAGIHLTKSSSSNYLRMDDGSNCLINFSADTNTAVMQVQETGFSSWKPLELRANYLVFKPNNTETMRLTSTGLGIGTSSPIQKLHVAGNIVLNASGFVGFGGGTNYIEGSSTNLLKFGTNNIERMRIDGSGSVGIGQTSLVDGDKLTVNGNFNLNGTLFNGTSNNSAGLNFTSNYVNMYGYSGIRFYAQAAGIGSMAERMRIDSSGSLLVGKTASGIANSGFEVGQSGQINVTQAGAVVARFNRKTSDGSILELTKDSTTVGSIGTHTSNMFIGSVDSGLYFDSTNNRISPYYVNNNSLPNGGISLGGNSNRFQDLYLSGTANVQYAGATDTGIYFNGSFNAVVPYRPDTGVAVDDYLDLGVYSHRWDDIFATNGTIQTSDRNEKQDIEDLTEAEERVAVAAKGLLKKFRWKSAVEDKGDDARIHFGIIAQDLQDAFEAEGLDAGRYGMFTSNTWTNEDGEEQTRMGVRYSELLAFIISAI